MEEEESKAMGDNDEHVKVEEEPPPGPVVSEKVEKLDEGKSVGGSTGRTEILAQVETERRFSVVKAWEENEKSKIENKAMKRFSGISTWENKKKATLEAKLKKMEENYEKKKAECREKMKNEIALLHKLAEEKKAFMEAERRKDVLATEELAENYRITGAIPKKSGCFG